MVTRLVLRRWTTDAAMGHAGAAVPGGGVAGIQEPPWESVALTDKGLRALSSLTALTSLSLYTTVQLLPCHPSAHAPQCDGVQRLAWRAT
jgi:hypothetical protein